MNTETLVIETGVETPPESGDSASLLLKLARRCGLVAVNVWLIFHCLAVVLPPFSVPPSPRVVQDTYTAIRFYPQLLFLDHGYHFFGPDPGDSTLIRYVATTEDDRRMRGQIPNRQIFPRLLYHRHFMLTEAIPRFENYDRDLHELQIHTYAQRLRREYDAETVKLYRVTHRLVEMERFLAGYPLDDPDTYLESELGSYSWPRSSALSDNR